MNLEQAQFEIEALQRRLAEYAGEVQRLRAQVEGLQCECQVYEAEQKELLAQVAQLRSALEQLTAKLHLAAEDAALWKKSEGECCAENERLGAQVKQLRAALEGLVDSCTTTGPSTVTCPDRSIRDAAKASLSTPTPPVVDREKAKVIAEALANLTHGVDQAVDEGYKGTFPIPACVPRMAQAHAALAIARELGLLEEK